LMPLVLPVPLLSPESVVPAGELLSGGDAAGLPCAFFARGAAAAMGAAAAEPTTFAASGSLDISPTASLSPLASAGLVAARLSAARSPFRPGAVDAGSALRAWLSFAVKEGAAGVTHHPIATAMARLNMTKKPPATACLSPGPSPLAGEAVCTT